jgi:hypothetical protein
MVRHTGGSENRTRRLKRKEIKKKAQTESHVQVVTTPKTLSPQFKAEYQRVYSAPRPLPQLLVKDITTHGVPIRAFLWERPVPPQQALTVSRMFWDVRELEDAEN